eukprot:TRINITY_DN49275_c0_g2_i1.p1 TRINITY_DN49275_c0_g2~~TRINITY_DN49275_c0_g2_i1.p1  ORF type:complete len:676 (+),score=124.01 TRINITY_DN49275_c0_g2_i1:25-2052(+)
MRVLLFLLCLVSAVAGRTLWLQKTPLAIAKGRRPSVSTVTSVRVPYTIDFDWYPSTARPTGRWRHILLFGKQHNIRYPLVAEYPKSKRLHVRIATRSPNYWNNGCDPTMNLRGGTKYHITVVITPKYMSVYINNKLGCTQPYKVYSPPGSLPVWADNPRSNPASGKVGMLRYRDGAFPPALPKLGPKGVTLSISPISQCGTNNWLPSLPKIALPPGMYEIQPTGGAMSWWRSGSKNWSWYLRVNFPDQKARSMANKKLNTQSGASAIAKKSTRLVFTNKSPPIYFNIPDRPCTDNRGKEYFRIVPVMCHRGVSLPRNALRWSTSLKLPAAQGTKLTVVCKSGYVGAPSTSSCNRGRWSTAICKPKPCSNRPSLKIGSYVGKCPTTLQHGQYCNVKCPSGYKLSGRLECDYGKWTVPNCHKPQPKSCNGLPNSLSSTIGHWTGCQNVNSGKYCKLVCNSGYKFSGNTNGALCSNGKYTSIPTCTARGCGSPPQLWHGSWVGSCSNVASGGTCQLKCNNGWTAPTSIIKCTRGQWNVASVKCGPKKCSGTPPLPSGAKWTQQGCATGSASGTSCQFTCPKGQIPHKPVMCRNGNWKPATCVKAPVWYCKCQAAFCDQNTRFGPKCKTANAAGLMTSFLLRTDQHTAQQEFGAGNVDKKNGKLYTQDQKWICSSWTGP